MSGGVSLLALRTRAIDGSNDVSDDSELRLLRELDCSTLDESLLCLLPPELLRADGARVAVAL